ncbi:MULTISPECIES: TetR/AcrR family transcriptional regulator [Mycolicibacterium]|jgi:AcrR family transcriptional regulator|nr:MULTISPECIES: TetR/AcrR family transcriptional regulator [Mycolicibacterium]MCV7130036.1 TetR/AcrR family transcriptional regulator [Mycolicibacterium vanbaalenii PYR-1]MDW5610181.1 TetR/AcrR family transcriptional regulator [Mycolicibacterium sp. D5.8-2]PQP46264.1 TetR/AcrR family transcriptional regulator [Mycolicibacterium austroafricanum]QZT57230.1 TetR/AcrR family transcriptional regulator [Mycolicibacterium austroafricanum]QZY46520.1 TetR/AcrR family transcriptional regulator [Mycolic
MPTTRSFDALLRSALDLIADGGIDGLTLSQVAEHAHVSRATAYREFGDKDGLVGAVAQHEIGLMLVAVHADIDTTADATALVASIVVSALRYLRSHRAFTYVRTHEPHWLLHAALAVGDSRTDLVQTVAAAVTPAIAVDTRRLRLSAVQAAEVMVRTVLSHTLIEYSTLTDAQVGEAVAHALITD